VKKEVPKKEEVKKKEKPVYPSTVSIVKDFIARQTESHVPSKEPGAIGQVANYDSSVAQLSCRISEDPNEFKEIDDRFKTVTDFDGNSMLEISRRYWDDPDFAEKMRAEIARGRDRRNAMRRS
jgi:hypothetical protein